MKPALYNFCVTPIKKLTSLIGNDKKIKTFLPSLFISLSFLFLFYFMFLCSLNHFLSFAFTFSPLIPISLPPSPSSSNFKSQLILLSSFY